MSGWLVNDCLTCIPGTRTFWHDLLEWLPDLQDKCNGYTPYAQLPDRIESEVNVEGTPDYIIRNCTFFRHMNINTKTISLIQDVYEGSQRSQQLSVANSSDVVVFNSPYTASLYKDQINTRTEIIPLGTNFELFKPKEASKDLGILPNSILFVGAQNNYPKGFDTLMQLVNESNHNFCLVMKDDFSINHPRIKVFNRVSHDVLVEIYNSCSMIVCTSRMETLHLGGIEAMACDLPVAGTNVGIYHDIPDGKWGKRLASVNTLDEIMSSLDSFSPRNYALSQKLDTKACKESWQKLIKSL